ncbi:hypothetical protein VCUG_00543 [Vavraia culicis subsp. floridensis]|uniref:Uncharacterized protein n=1 Tax=Vavraia culicis (isolate floridensis) TaxID=948595 RepID=L2GXZ7_VAVCU|nr:uncharacterized protein VCUG_00543 [Vavraia culicis subsp. floridensis]ELA47960.1 hypothetical protein VCUG_00543 [Vavraia culicis subsp. floridensis]
MPYSDIPDTVNTDNQNDTEPVLDPGKLPDDSDAFKFNMTCGKLPNVNGAYCTSGIVNEPCNTGNSVSWNVGCTKNHALNYGCIALSDVIEPDYSKITGLSLDCVSHQNGSYSECNGVINSKLNPEKEQYTDRSVFKHEKLPNSHWIFDVGNSFQFNVKCVDHDTAYNPQRANLSSDNTSYPSVYENFEPLNTSLYENVRPGSRNMNIFEDEYKDNEVSNDSDALVMKCVGGTGVKERYFDEGVEFRLHKIEENDNGTIYTVESGVGGHGPSRITGLEINCPTYTDSKLNCDGKVYFGQPNSDRLLKAEEFDTTSGIPKLSSNESNRLYDAVCTDVTNSLCSNQESSSNYQDQEYIAGAVAVYITLFLGILVIITALVRYLKKRRAKRQQSVIDALSEEQEMGYKKRLIEP